MILAKLALFVLVLSCCSPSIRAAAVIPAFIGTPQIFSPPVAEPQVVAPVPKANISAPVIPANLPIEVGGRAQTFYHCEDPEGYYPAVTACPSGWAPILIPSPNSSGN